MAISYIDDAELAPKHTKFTIAICGGGIAGLTLALALQRMSSDDIHIDIYESAKKFTEIGAGIGVWKRPWKILKNLDLADELSKLTAIPTDEDAPKLAFQMRKSDQPQGFQYYDMVTPMGNLVFHRADFLHVLASKLDPASTASHFSKRLTSYTQAGSDSSSSSQGLVTLHFVDGTTSTCDVLVGADGIHSATRHCLFKEIAEAIGASDSDKAKLLLSMLDPMWSGSVAYRAVVPSERLGDINPNHSALKVPQNYTGKNKHVIVFPISHNSVPLVNIVAFCSWPDKEGSDSTGDIIHTCDKEEVRAQYVGWEAEVQQLIECMETPTKWTINALRGLPICVHGRVALMGDAAHAMTPHQGSGAGQAIEDAYVLAGLLAHPKTTPSTLSEALKVYEAVRLPHANDIQRRSRMNGRLYEFADLPWAQNDGGPADGRTDVNGDIHAFESEGDEAEDNPPRVNDGAINGRKDLSEDLTDVEKLKQIGDAATANWAWAWMSDVDEDLKRALGMLEERVATEEE